jgi:hypothetical protein
MSLTDNLEHDEDGCSCQNCGNNGFDDRDIILSKLNEAIDYLHNKSMKGRITNDKNEKVRIAWFKALAYACSIYNQIKKDADLEDLQRQVQELSEQIKRMDK